MHFLDNLFIPQSMKDTADGFEAVVRCNAAHPVYQVHFPGNPITPGACLLQLAGDLMRQKTGRPLYLKSSKNIKFLSILTPEQGKEVRFVFSHLVESETECRVQVVIADEQTVFSKMSLTFFYEPL